MAPVLQVVGIGGSLQLGGPSIHAFDELFAATFCSVFEVAFHVAGGCSADGGLDFKSEARSSLAQLSCKGVACAAIKPLPKVDVTNRMQSPPRLHCHLSQHLTS